MNYRKHWKDISNQHYDLTLKLHSHGLHDAVVMNSGYTIECALKAALCNRTDEYLSPEKGNYKTHNFDSLLTKANLKDEFRDEQRRSPRFKAYWSTVSKWNPELRYEILRGKSLEVESDRQVDAISDKKEGVKRWVENYW